MSSRNWIILERILFFMLLSRTSWRIIQNMTVNNTVGELIASERFRFWNRLDLRLPVHGMLPRPSWILLYFPFWVGELAFLKKVLFLLDLMWRLLSNYSILHDFVAKCTNNPNTLFFISSCTLYVCFFLNISCAPTDSCRCYVDRVWLMIGQLLPRTVRCLGGCRTPIMIQQMTKRRCFF